MKKNVSLMALLGGKIKFDKHFTTDVLDIEILRKINGGIDGTIDLSKFIRMAPKNLLNRIKKYQKLELIETSKTKQKPKGWKRHFKLSEKGKQWINASDDLKKRFEELEKKFK